MEAKRIVFVLLALLLAGCYKPGADYLGKWKAADGKHAFEISQNGDNFLVKITEPAYRGFFTNDPGTTTTNLAGTVKNSLRKIDGPFGCWTATYVKDSDSLVFPTPAGGTTPYKRAK